MTLPSWHVPVEGVTNFRDAGGWPTVDGRRMRLGRFYRADDPIRITEAGRRTVDGLGLRRVVDLRQDAQVMRAPGYLDADRTSHIALVDQVIKNEAPPPLETETDIAQLYRNMLIESHERLTEVLDVLAADIGDGPVMVHCAYGKDRAGLVTALVQATVGVERESMIADFTRSHEPSQARRRLLQAQPRPDDPPIGHLPDMLFSARAATLDTLFTMLEEEFGDLATWAASYPTRPGTAERLRQALVE